MPDVTVTDVRRVNADYGLEPPLTVTLARQLADPNYYMRARQALAINYGDDLAGSVESAILQCLD